MGRYYKTFKLKLIDKLVFVFILVIIVDVFLYNLFVKSFSDNTTLIVINKVDEITKYYLNNVIKLYLNNGIDDYININYVNNNNIYSVSIDNKKANKLLSNIIDDLNNMVKDIEDGKISDYYNLELLENNKGLVMYVPTGIVLSNSLLTNFGPRVPVKLSFLENINAYVDVIVNNYGINNSLVKIYIIINIEEIIEMPINNNIRKDISYKYLLSSKLIVGKIPNIIGTDLNTHSNIVKSSVN